MPPNNFLYQNPSRARQTPYTKHLRLEYHLVNKRMPHYPPGASIEDLTLRKLESALCWTPRRYFVVTFQEWAVREIVLPQPQAQRTPFYTVQSRVPHLLISTNHLPRFTAPPGSTTPRIAAAASPHSTVTCRARTTRHPPDPGCPYPRSLRSRGPP
jgi:hypothetical protein